MPVFLQQLIEWFLPYTCVFCAAKGHQQHDICEACYADLPWIYQACQQCALPLASAISNGKICGACLKDSPSYDRTIAAFHYQNPVDYLISHLKFHNQLVYARLLGQLLLAQLAKNYSLQNRPQLIIPMPLHRSRLQQRGFNQAVEIARPIAKAWQIPLVLQACQRIRATPAQAGLAAMQRRKNVKKAFGIKADFTAQHVAIIDDVITTGSTVHELSLQLRRHGVKRIDVWCCARTKLT